MTSNHKAYQEVQDLVKQIGGTMGWRPAGRGGIWQLDLAGRQLCVTIRSMQDPASILDRMYVKREGVVDPVGIYDYSDNLRDDAIWVLMTAPDWEPVVPR